MPRGNNTKTAKGVSGAGTIRRKTVKRNGKEYTYWEARFTTGFDPGTGKQIQKSVSGKTQADVARKLREATVEVDRGLYIEPAKLTVAEWLDIWTEEYLSNVKPRTVQKYKYDVQMHIKPPPRHGLRHAAGRASVGRALYADLPRRRAPSAQRLRPQRG